MTYANLNTAARISTLRDEAGAAGDLEQVAICTRALEGDTMAWDACMDILDAIDLERDQDPSN